MTAELVVPILLRHFHKKNGRLIATVVAVKVANNNVAVGIARCNKHDRASRAKGRALAAARVARGLGFRGYNSEESLATPSLVRYERDKNLFKVMSQHEFEELVATNPFNKWGCPFGAYSDEVEALKPKKLKKAKKKTAKKKCNPKKTPKK